VTAVSRLQQARTRGQLVVHRTDSVQESLLYYYYYNYYYYYYRRRSTYHYYYQIPLKIRLPILLLPLMSR
jgi:hypothetical protein